MERVRFQVWSDYLCPWCYNASRRLLRLADEVGPELELEWRSFLLRPRPRPGRDLDRFREYTRTWLRPAAEPDGAPFRVWEGDAGPPSHSIPPQLAAKAAARLGPEAFKSLHSGLLRAYFEESRDVTDPDTLRSLWAEAGLAPEAFAGREDPALLRETLEQHQEALDSGVAGVPAVRLAGDEPVIVGAQPYELYRRWFDRTRARMKEESNDG